MTKKEFKQREKPLKMTRLHRYGHKKSAMCLSTQSLLRGNGSGSTSAYGLPRDSSSVRIDVSPTQLLHTYVTLYPTSFCHQRLVKRMKEVKKFDIS